MQTIATALFVAIIVIACESVPVVEKAQIESQVDDYNLLNDKCQTVRGKDEAETHVLRQNCELIYSNEYIKWSERMLSNKTFVKDLKVVDVTLQSKKSRTKRSILATSTPGCPTFNQAYLQENRDTPKKMSTSPWDFVVNYDKNRIPKEILDTTCLCRGCIDMDTGLEDFENLVSVPMKLTIPIEKRSTILKIDIHVGCTCMIPITKK